jgi:hypothetical protein
MILTACGGTLEKSSSTSVLPGSPPPGTKTQIIELAEAIRALGPDVNPDEAARAARISYEHTHELAIQYEITDSALVHNVKVNLGIKPRGLCKHWAQDMEKRLKAEEFETLTIHRAIGGMIGVDHSTAIISRRGDDLYDGIVLDPWRKGGRLTWVPTIRDTAWGWVPQFQVLDQFAFAVAKERGQTSIKFRSEGGTERCLVVTGEEEYMPSTPDLTQCIKEASPWPTYDAFAGDETTEISPS